MKGCKEVSMYVRVKVSMYVSSLSILSNKTSSMALANVEWLTRCTKSDSTFFVKKKKLKNCCL